MLRSISEPGVYPQTSWLKKESSRFWVIYIDQAIKPKKPRDTNPATIGIEIDSMSVLYVPENFRQYGIAVL